MSTRLFHAQYHGISGLYFQLQSVPCFLPSTLEKVYVLKDTAALHTYAALDDDLARTITAAYIEPCLEPQKVHIHLRDKAHRRDA